MKNTAQCGVKLTHDDGEILTLPFTSEAAAREFYKRAIHRKDVTKVEILTGEKWEKRHEKTP